MTSYRHVTEIREHMVEIRKCCNVWPMFVRLKLGLKMLEEYHPHYALLVGAIAFLSGRSILSEQLEIARKFLMHFVEMCGAHYG